MQLCSRTFRKQPGLPRLEVLSQKPAISKIIIPLNELDTLTSFQCEFIVGTCGKIVWMRSVQVFERIFCHLSKSGEDSAAKCAVATQE
jgi:hypothetical protein